MIAENRKTILLVEDEVLIALGKQKDLENYGYNVLTTNTGEKAVALSKENDNIDLYLMDIDLGRGIDGTEAAELILRDRDIPVVFMSSHMEPEVVEKTEKITSYGYVVKSSSITVLDASIKMAFKLFKAHKKIYESEEKYRTLFEKESDAIIIYDPETTNILDVNEATSKIYGYNKDELLGMSCLKLSAEVEESVSAMDRTVSF